MSRITKLSRSLRGSVVLITGAGSGMGKATAELFSDEGAITIVTDINENNINEVVSVITKSGNQADGFVLDVGSKVSISAAINNIIKK